MKKQKVRQGPFVEKWRLVLWRFAAVGSSIVAIAALVVVGLLALQARELREENISLHRFVGAAHRVALQNSTACGASGIVDLGQAGMITIDGILTFRSKESFFSRQFGRGGVMLQRWDALTEKWRDVGWRPHCYPS